MNKAYNKITWQNKPSTATPLNQTNLNEMSNALDTIDDRVIALDSGKVSSVTVTNTLPTGDTIATITVDGTATNIKSAQVEVDAEPSATSANPLQNKAIYEMMNNLLPEETVQGNPIAISDASGLNAKACSVDLLPIQDLHGYDSPWAGGAGKNKLQVTTQSYSTSGVTIAVNNGILTLSNTSTDNIQINLVTTRINVSDIGSSYKLVDDGSFTFSSNLYLNIRYYDSNGSAISNQSMNYATKSMNLVIPNNATTFMPMVVIKSGVATNGTIKPMLMLQSVTDNSFAPYSNICPITGRNSVELARTGKNKFDENYTEISTGNKYLSIYVGNGTYTMSTTAPRFSGGGACLFFQPNQVTGGASTSANGVWSGQTRTVTSTDGYVTITYRKDNSINPEDYNTQIELGSTATPYEPYQGSSTYTETLGQTVYGGKVDFVSGEGQIDLRIINENDFTTVSSGTTPNGYHWADVNIGYIPTFNISNMLPNKNGDSGWGSNVPCFGYVTSGAYKYMRVYCAESTLADFKTAYAGLQIVFSRETPATLTLTPTQIALLRGNNVISTDGDNIILKYSADIGLYIAGQLQNS